MLVAQTDYVHEGGFYDGTGSWKKQRVAGVHWLTSYQGFNTACRAKTIAVDQEHAVLLWEKWSCKPGVKDWSKLHYEETWGTVVRVQGSEVTVNAAKLLECEGEGVRLSRRDDLMVIGKHIVWFGSGSGARELELTALELHTCMPEPEPEPEL
jgi:hypothetical protein